MDVSLKLDFVNRNENYFTSDCGARWSLRHAASAERTNELVVALVVWRMPRPRAFQPSTWDTPLLRFTGVGPRFEQFQVDCVSHRAVASIVGMQVIPGIVLGKDLSWVRRIANNGIEIDHAIVAVAFPEPGVERISFGLAFRGPIDRGSKRKQSAAKDFETMLVRALDHLLMSRDQVRHQWRCIVPRQPNVIDPFEHDDVGDARLCGARRDRNARGR